MLYVLHSVMLKVPDVACRHYALWCWKCL